jgi:hypothetical protein
MSLDLEVSCLRAPKGGPPREAGCVRKSFKRVTSRGKRLENSAARRFKQNLLISRLYSESVIYVPVR